MLYVRVRQSRNAGFYLPVAAGPRPLFPFGSQKLTPFNFSARDGLAGLRTIRRMLTNTPMLSPDRFLQIASIECLGRTKALHWNLKLDMARCPGCNRYHFSQRKRSGADCSVDQATRNRWNK